MPLSRLASTSVPANPSGLTHTGVQVPLSPEEGANLRAIRAWYNSLMEDAKHARPKKRRTDPVVLAAQQQWIDGETMLQLSFDFLMEGEPQLTCLDLHHCIVLPTVLVLSSGLSSAAVSCTGAAIHQRMQQPGYRVMQEEMDTFLIGVLIPFMYGYFGPVRPGALISLCHPDYQVPCL